MPDASASSLFLRNAAQLITLAGPPLARRGAALGELGFIARGGLLTEGETILRLGSTRQLEREALRLRAEAIDCRGRVVIPGFVDSHTHLIFAGSRVEDYDLRLRGKTYEEIARAGGGIGSSAQKVRKAGAISLVHKAARFLEQFAAHGTTTVEVKTGYGLDLDQELKILRVIRMLQTETALDLVPTLLALHALPANFKGRAGRYEEEVIARLIPAVAQEKLAEFIDCFCDRGAFSVEDCRRVLAAGKKFGLVPRIHAEQLSRTGAALLGIECGAASADHLDQVSAGDIRALARSNVVATLLPGANFHLGLKK
jgi:imidazolonepropionase